MPLAVSNSSALGGALRAAQAVSGMAWDDLFARFAPPERQLRVEPDSATQPVYEEMAAKFKQRLAQVLTEASA
jgi:sugar (pentulose or hexulose) kinase